jgi:hypothetical protein
MRRSCRRRSRISTSPKFCNSSEQIRSNVMKSLCVVCVVIGVSLTATAAFDRGGMGGMHGMGASHMSVD